MKSAHWLTNAMQKHAISASQLARQIGISQPQISRHLNGVDNTLKDEHCIALAALLEIDPAIIIADQHLERAKSPEERAVWQRVGKLIAHGMAATVAAAAIMGSPALSIDSPKVLSDNNYRSYRKRWRALKAYLFAPVARRAYS